MRTLRLFSGLLVLSLVSSAQDITPLRVGLHSGINVNIHNTAFPTSQQTSLPYFDATTPSMTGAIGAMLQVPLSTNIAVGGRLTYTSLSNVTYEATQNGQTTSLTPTLPVFEILPTIGVRDLLLSEHLWLWGGIEAGIPLGWSYEQRDTTASSSQDIPGTLTRIALAVGAAYDIPLSERWILQPELSIRFPLTQVSSDRQFDSWTIPQVRLGVNFFYALTRSQTDTNTLPSEPYVQARINRVISITPDGDTVPVRSIKLEDVRYTEYFPLVPYIFFPAGSASPSQYYQIRNERETGQIVFDTLKNSLDINANLLSVICQRMKQYPTAVLTLVGTNDGRSELRSRSLSLQRAQGIRSTLIRCGVDSMRIQVEARDLPEKPSAPNDPDGIAENRRVEFRASTPELLEPFQSRVGVERLASPDAIIFIPEISSSDPIKQWELTITQAGRTLRTFRQEGTPRPVTWTIQPSELSPQQVPLDYTFRAESVVGRTAETNGSIDIEYYSSTRKAQERAKDRTIEKFSLILFDFDSDVITTENQRVLDLKVVPAIKPGSTVKIFGYTDRIGEPNYNLSLSRRRAKAVMDYLRTKRPEATYQTAGYGEALELFNNDLPTGRQLNRTVQIIIETPIQTN